MLARFERADDVVQDAADRPFLIYSGDIAGGILSTMPVAAV